MQSLKLQSIYPDANELTCVTVKAARLIGGEPDESVLVKVGGLARKSLVELKSCQAEVTDNLSYVDAVAERLGNL